MATTDVQLVIVKRKCCDDKPRCRRCPLAWEAMERKGVVQRASANAFVVCPDVGPKKLAKALKKARSRKKKKKR